MMQFGSLDDFNRIIGRVGSDWLSGAHVPQFDRLVGEIRALQRPGDTFEIPSHLAPKAWQQAWPVYQRLRERQEREAHSPEAAEGMAAYQRRRAVDRRWNEFLGHRTELLDNIQRSPLRRPDLLAALSLVEADLGQPALTPNDEGVSWVELEPKILRALNLWRKLHTGDQTLIEFKIASLRGDEAARWLAVLQPRIVEALNGLEQRNDALEARIVALETAGLASVDRSKCGEA